MVLASLKDGIERSDNGETTLPVGEIEDESRGNTNTASWVLACNLCWVALQKEGTSVENGSVSCDQGHGT